MVVIKERMLVVDTDAGLCFPPLAGIPIAKGEVGLLVAKCGQGHVTLVADGSCVTLIAILVCLVHIFGIDGRVGIAGTDKQAQAVNQKVELLGQFGIYPQLTLMRLVKA